MNTTINKALYYAENHCKHWTMLVICI